MFRHFCGLPLHNAQANTLQECDCTCAKILNYKSPGTLEIETFQTQEATLQQTFQFIQGWQKIELKIRSAKHPNNSYFVWVRSQLSGAEGVLAQLMKQTRVGVLLESHWHSPVPTMPTLLPLNRTSRFCVSVTSVCKSLPDELAFDLQSRVFDFVPSLIFEHENRIYLDLSSADRLLKVKQSPFPHRRAQLLEAY